MTLAATQSGAYFVGFLMVAKQADDEYVGQFVPDGSLTQGVCKADVSINV